MAQMKYSDLVKAGLPLKYNYSRRNNLRRELLIISVEFINILVLNFIVALYLTKMDLHEIFHICKYL